MAFLFLFRIVFLLSCFAHFERGEGIAETQVHHLEFERLTPLGAFKRTTMKNVTVMIFPDATVGTFAQGTGIGTLTVTTMCSQHGGGCDGYGYEKL